MPRQSDVYATLGAPGIYQATPCTPFRLPNVYVFPPEEDDQDAYCLFHSGSASPTAFESFYIHPAYTQRDPNSPTFTDLRALDHALSYFQHSTAYGSARQGPWSSWEGEERIQNGPPPRNSGSTMSSASSWSSLSDSLQGSSAADAATHIRSNARYHVEKGEGGEEQLWLGESTAASRRSSVFGDRDYDISNYRGRGDQPASKTAQTLTLRSRAVTALKGFGRAMTRRLEGDALVSECRKDDDAHAEPAIQESWFEPSDGLRRKRSRRTLGRLIGSRSNVDIHSISDTGSGVDEITAEGSHSPPSPTPSSGWDPSLNKRNSMNQLFGLTGSSVGIKAKTSHSHLDANKCGSVAAAGDSKLSRRKSLTQLLGLGRGEMPTALSDHTIMPLDADSELSSTIIGSSSNSSMAPRSERSGSLVSLATSGTTAPLHNRRKSFLSKRSFSFLDLHRRFAIDPGSRPSQSLEHHTSPAAPPMDSTAPFSPDSLSERTSSSSVAVSTECEHTTGDVMRFPESHAEVVHIPAIVGESGRGLAKDLGPTLISGVRLDLSEDSSFLSSFGLSVPDEDVENEAEGHPTMELAVRLDSLNFDQLMFDPQTFMDAIYD